MAIACVALALLSQASGMQVELDAPDSVEVGGTFTVELTITDAAGGEVSMEQEHGPGVTLVGRSSMSSFRSTTGPGGTTMVSTITYQLSYSALSPGEQTVGPFRLRAAAGRTLEVPELTVHVAGEPLRTSDVPASIDVSVDTTMTFYPGVPIPVTYELTRESAGIEFYDLTLDSPGYAGVNLTETPETLQWKKWGDGRQTAFLAELEVVPAFPCSLDLPRVEGVVLGVSGFPYPRRQVPVSSPPLRVAVLPFPEEGMPEGFDGVVDSVSADLEQVRGSWSTDGERALSLSVTGPGSRYIAEAPELSVSGPAELVPAGEERGEEGVTWTLVADPSDSGTVIVGPDTLYWLERGSSEYRPAVVPPCTLRVERPPATVPLRIGDDEEGGSLVLPLAAAAIGLLGVAALILRSGGGRSRAPTLDRAADPEEVLTAYERRLSGLLLGREAHIGADTVEEELQARGVDAILTRRILRFWRDLELGITGGATGHERTAALRRTATEIVSELESALGCEGGEKGAGRR